jgi:fructosamine-3-kinase
VASWQDGRVALRIAELRPVGSQHGVSHAIGTLDDGRQVFVKESASASAGFAAEAHGLRWLAQAAGGAPVPEVLDVDDARLVIAYLPPGRPESRAAAEFGAALARTHAAGAESFGASWAGQIASLPLDNTPGAAWPDWYAERRVLPFLRRASDAGSLDKADVSLIESAIGRVGELAGPPEPPARIHGDLWSGNVLWSRAHGGHRETDLAMLALFGAPHLDRILGAYDDAFALADGWRERVPLHQLHPLLVHVCLFGGSYREQTLAAARRALRGG